LPADGQLPPLLDSQQIPQRTAHCRNVVRFPLPLRWYFNGDDGTPDTILNFAEATNEIMPEYVLGKNVLDYCLILKRPISMGLGQPDRWAFLL
jgi:hypothetical protein